MKPLKILLANNTLSLLAGSETWTRTLALQLKSMGHIVSCYSPTLGIISDQLKESGIRCYETIYVSKIKPFNYVLEEAIDHNYDVIIANHHHIVEYLREQFPKTPIIATIHGIIHFDENGNKAPEHPALDSGVNQFVAVSEEVQEMLKKDYNIDSILIRNAFDIKQFNSLKPANDEPKQFLINTNYQGRDNPVVATIREASKHFNAKVAAIGENFSPMVDVTKAIEDSDIVFGMGRSVLEGVAAGRLGICLGRWGMGGVITEGTVDDIRHFNFSGRNSGGIEALSEDLIELIKKHYNKSTLEWGKNYIARDHNIVLAADEYVRLARELTGEMFSKPSNLGVASDTKPFRLAKS